MSDPTEMVLQLWRAVPERVRLSFERHPVDEVRALAAECARLQWSLKNADEDNDVIRAERDRLARMHSQICEIAVQRYQEIERLREERDAAQAALRLLMEQALEGASDDPGPIGTEELRMFPRRDQR